MDCGFKTAWYEPRSQDSTPTRVVVPESDKGEGGGHPDPNMKGLRSPKKIFFRPFGSQFDLKIMGAPPLVPLLQVVVSIRQLSSNLHSAD